MEVKILDPPFDAEPDIPIKKTPVPLTLALHNKVKNKATKLNVTMRSLLMAAIIQGVDGVKTQQNVVDIIHEYAGVLKEGGVK